MPFFDENNAGWSKEYASIKNLILVPALRLDFPDAEILPFCVENHL